MVVKLVTTEKRDNFQKSTSLQGPDLSNVRYKSLFLRATKFDAGSSIYQVYVRDQYAGQWRFYNSAYDIDGNKLEFTSIKREVGSCRGGCDYYEDMGVSVTREYLEQRKDRGLKIKISGSAGEVVVELPPGYIQGFLEVSK